MTQIGQHSIDGIFQNIQCLREIAGVIRVWHIGPYPWGAGIVAHLDDARDAICGRNFHQTVIMALIHRDDQIKIGEILRAYGARAAACMGP